MYVEINCVLLKKLSPKLKNILLHIFMWFYLFNTMCFARWKNWTYLMQNKFVQGDFDWAWSSSSQVGRRS